jgi:cathepsin B
LQRKFSSSLVTDLQESKSEEYIQIEQNVAEQRAIARVKLGIEGDLRRFKSKIRAYREDEDCQANAEKAFLEGLDAANLTGELSEEEKENFRARFVEEMLADCKYDADVVAHWVELVAEGLEHQKPIVTQAFVDSVNKANLGYTVRLDDYMKNESKQDFDNQLGMDVNFADPKNLTVSLLELESVQIPDTFDSATKVPNCAETVRKIHNQGTCGSCWAFGTLSAVDSRLCIATNGVFSGPKAVLSRGYSTSCSTPSGHNGCNGGWWSMVYNLLGEGIHCGRRGGGCSGGPGNVLGTDVGCVPYFGHGSGVDHFNSKSSAPPCQTQCVKHSTPYFRPLKEDLYVMPGGSSWARGALEFEGYNSKEGARKARQAIYEKGPLPYAVKVDGTFQSYSSGVMRGQCQKSPNHCVTAIGYGTDYFDSLNSWGPNWGDKGGFKLADCMATHWSVPPDMPTGNLPNVPDSLGPQPAPTPGPPSPGPGPDGEPEAPEVCHFTPNKGKQIKGQYAGGVKTKLDLEAAKAKCKELGKAVCSGVHSADKEGEKYIVRSGTLSDDAPSYTTAFVMKCSTKPPEPPRKPMKPVWTVTEGPCVVDGSSCMLTPNYKPGGDGAHDECEGKSSKYGPNETCTFDLLVDVSPAIEVVDFSTEKGFDIFTVNGIEFSGAGNATEKLQGLVPNGTMTWTSDKGFEKTGFRLCPKDPREDMTFVGTIEGANGTMFAMYVMKAIPGEEATPWPDFQAAGSFKHNGTLFNMFVSSGGFLPTPTPAPPGGPAYEVVAAGQFCQVKFGTTGKKLGAKDTPGSCAEVVKADSGCGDVFYHGCKPGGTCFCSCVASGNDCDRKANPDSTIYKLAGSGPSPGPSPGPAPPPPAPTPPPPAYDDPDAPAWLLVHNYFRCIHDTDPIEWDKDVASGSATWAQRGQMSHAKCYSIPAPKGPSGENLAAGQKDINAAVFAWYDESPERGPGCGGHCTALLWKKSKALGCARKNTWNGNRPMYVCRYAQSAANFGSKSDGVNMPDYTKEPECYNKFPVSKRWKAGEPSGSGSMNSADNTDGKGPATIGNSAEDQA